MHRAIANYAATGKDDVAVLAKFGGLVEKVARRLVLRTGMSSHYDDLWSAGALGLLEAVRRFDSERGVTFETFAEHRIRGAMLDELRRMDHLPRRLRSRTDDVQKARKKLSDKLGRDATTEEVASEMQIDIEEVAVMESLLEPVVPLDTALPFLKDDASLDDPLLRAEAMRTLTSAIEGLPERLQLLLSLHYVEDLTYREIAQIFKISEPRVCQLHAEAVSKLREIMK